MVAPILSMGREGLVYVASSERRAEEIARALRSFAPSVSTLHLPAWDCLPYDRASPSREIMGRRMDVLARLEQTDEGPRALIVSPETLLQRVPPASAIRAGRLMITCGQVLPRAELEAFARRTGYVFDERIDEPGEIAIFGEVADVFPPALEGPVRIRFGDRDKVVEIADFDPLTQRSSEPLQELSLGPASELVLASGCERAPGQEHLAPATYGKSMRPVLSLLPAAAVALDRDAVRRLTDLEALISEAHLAQQNLGQARPPPPSALYLSTRSVSAALARRKRVEINSDGVEAAPNFALSLDPARAFADQVRVWLAAGRKVVLTGLPHEQRPMLRALERRLEQEVTCKDDWEEVSQTPAEDLLFVPADLESGFDAPGQALCVVAASDLLGDRLNPRDDQRALLADPDLRPGDLAIHEDHGLGKVVGLERVSIDGVEREALRLSYFGDAGLLVPIEDLDKVWRYGGDPEVVGLDRLHTDAWTRRRAEISRDIDDVAAHLVALTKERQAIKGLKIKPPRAGYARFAARFPFPETADQSAAIEAVLSDMASGRVMQRLVCGDVGFGKTEVAMRAAAAAALAGHQVALIAPTTVLARQHFESLRRRFAGTGVDIGQLSRLTSAAEAEAVKAGLADGSVGVVVGTHALAVPGIRFRDLGLLIIDEEQRFGARLKADLAALAPDAHRLTMTATPIPRTLQLAMVGLQDVSVIATPPARRRPIRTFLAPFDPATLRTALLRERARGGQSFVVVPRISDIQPLADQLARLCPELTVRVAHGDLPAQAVDDAMIAFSSGEGDILLATSIIESGLDVPRANTMLVCRADLFGLAQLHQLRGRVGRGRAQGVAYLFHDPVEPLGEAARARLGTLEAFDRLGSGLAISAQDLEARGAGDLAGEEQAGHVRLIGTALYQRLLAAAVRAAKGEPAAIKARPAINVGLTGVLTQSYIPDETVRLNLYARLARMEHVQEVAAFEEELEDRFGPPSPEVLDLLALTRLRTLAAAAGVARIDAGPKAIALRFQGPVPPAPAGFSDLDAGEDRMLWPRVGGDDGETARNLSELLEALRAP
ncbi:helicase-related protein [Phenylobacterium sp. LjRoot164]|uniref:DEAD/DEAH box helicase n=1 Tax=unclassified Phenylobacterium TaxID=2640670 RepID=UPI003ECD46D6